MEDFPCSKGVPQGSVLVPLLFNIYVADLHPMTSRYNVSLPSFADDMSLYCSRTSLKSACSDVSTALTTISTELDSRVLKINCEKTWATLICPRSNGFPKAFAGESSLANITCDGKRIPFGEQHTIAGSNCWLQSILEGPCRPSLSESEPKDWGSQAILPPTNTICKASVLSLGDSARSRICSFSHRTKHGGFTKESPSYNLAKGGSVCSRKWLSGQCGTPCKTVKDSFVRTLLGPGSGTDRVPLQAWLCSLSSDRQVKTK